MVGHRKGGIGPGRYPVKASRAIIKLIQSAMDNARHQYEDIDAEEMEITHIAAHRGQIRRGWIPRARGRATPSNHYQVNLEIFLEDFNTVDDELEDEFEVDIMSGKQSVLRTIVNRNVERQLVKEFLMENTKSAGFGGLTINRTPNGTSVEIRAEKPGRVIGKRGKIINDLQKRLDEEFDLFNPRLSVEEVEDPTLNAQVMAQKIASALERGWYYRRAGASAAVNIMEKVLEELL